MPATLTLENQVRRFESDRIRIGTAPDNEISLPYDSRLAPLHAVIRSINGRWIVESSAGIQVRIGDRRPVPFAWLNPGDVIRLTEAGPDVVFEPAVSDSPPPLPTTIPAPIPQSLAVPLVAPSLSPPPSPLSPAPIPKSPAIPAEFPSLGPQPSALSPAPAPPFDRLPVRIGAVLVPITLIVAVWGFWPRSAKTNISLPPVASESDSGPRSDTPVSRHAVDPQDYLVLIGIGDLATDKRPHVLGVGWLYDQQTAVVPRTLGDVLSELVTMTKQEGSARQACVIQGFPLEVAEIVQPAGCSKISLLRLKDAAELPAPARERWLSVSEKDIQRRREKAKSKPVMHVSYSALPRSPGIQGSHGLSLIAYDPENVETNTEEAHFLFEQGRHVLTSSDPKARLERGGVLVDEEGRIVGMTLLDSSVVWTASLQQAFGAR